MSRISDEVDEQAVAELTARLIAANTTNPPGDERPVVPVLFDALHAVGCHTEVIECAPGRPSVLARYGNARPGAPVLAVNGHLDVVPVDHSQWRVDPFAGVIENGYVIGRGACDMKGGIASAIEALRVLHATGTTPSCAIELHLVADEETGGTNGTVALAEQGRIRVDACIVAEPTDLDVAVAERGTVMATIEVDGIAAHATRPDLGHSAIADAARIVDALHLRDFGAPPHALLGSPTCNVGTIAGGIAPNMVAPRAVLTVDRRILPGQTEESALAEIRDILDALDPRIRYRLHTDVVVGASAVDPASPFVDLVMAAASRHVESPAIVGSYLGTDARVLRNDLGVPTVVFGPGSPSRAHTADESVPCIDLVRAAQTFVDVFTTFGVHQTPSEIIAGRGLDP